MFKIILLTAALTFQTTSVANAECDVSFVKYNALFIHATVKCNVNFMDTPGGYYALAMAKQCRNMRDAAMKRIFDQVTGDFDAAARRNGIANACVLVKNLESAIEHDATN